MYVWLSKEKDFSAKICKSTPKKKKKKKEKKIKEKKHQGCW